MSLGLFVPNLTMFQHQNYSLHLRWHPSLYDKIQHFQFLVIVLFSQNILKWIFLDITFTLIEALELYYVHHTI